MKGVVLCLLPKNILMLQVIDVDTTKCGAYCTLLGQTVRQSVKKVKRHMIDVKINCQIVREMSKRTDWKKTNKRMGSLLEGLVKTQKVK